MLEIIANERLDIGQINKFNPSSHGQLARILFLPRGKGGLGLTFDTTLLGERLTSSAMKRKLHEGIGFLPKIDDYSTDKNALKNLSEAYNHDIIPKIIRYRASLQASALFFEKYLDLAIPDHIEEGAYCLHPTFHQVGARTFRYSSSNPNGQQITNPRGSDSTVSYNGRYAFEPRKGYVLLSNDYKQQELRLAASIGPIQSVIDMIHNGLDPNAEFTKKAWGGEGNESGYRAMSFALDLGRERPSTDQVTAAWKEIGWTPEKAKKYNYYSPYSVEIAKEWLAKYDYDIVLAEKNLGRNNTRTRIKMCVFGVLFGGGWRALIGILFVTAEDAKRYVEDVHRVLPEIREWSNRLVKQAKIDGYVINPFGRKLRIDMDYSYKAVNYQIQSSAACLMKNAMYGVRQFFLQEKLDAHLLMTIHDELLIEISESDMTDDVLKKIGEIMGNTEGRICLPMPVETKICRNNWYDKEEWHYKEAKRKFKLKLKGVQ
jgi:DNA polymerase I-like protein with 3'-5' exonuclease and polymerase domains